MFKRTFGLTEEEKHKVSDMCGDIMLWMLEGRSIGYMSEKLKLKPWEVEENLNETLYVLRKKVGIRRYLRILFYKE